MRKPDPAAYDQIKAEALDYLRKTEGGFVVVLETEEAMEAFVMVQKEGDFVEIVTRVTGFLRLLEEAHDSLFRTLVAMVLTGEGTSIREEGIDPT